MATAGVKWAHLCDYAFADQFGKPCLIGVFEVITAQHVPAQHTRAVLAFNVAGEPHEEISLRVEIVRPDKGVLLSPPAMRARLSSNGQQHFFLGIDNLILPDWGPYEINILIDDRLRASVSFEVRRPPQMGQVR